MVGIILMVQVRDDGLKVVDYSGVRRLDEVCCYSGCMGLLCEVIWQVVELFIELGEEKIWRGVRNG